MTRRPGHENCRAKCTRCGLTWCADCDTDGACKCPPTITISYDQAAKQFRPVPPRRAYWPNPIDTDISLTQGPNAWFVDFAHRSDHGPKLVGPFATQADAGIWVAAARIPAFYCAYRQAVYPAYAGYKTRAPGNDRPTVPPTQVRKTLGGWQWWCTKENCPSARRQGFEISQPRALRVADSHARTWHNDAFAKHARRETGRIYNLQRKAGI